MTELAHSLGRPIISDVEKNVLKSHVKLIGPMIMELN